MVKNTDEWRFTERDIVDPFWWKAYVALRESRIPQSVALPAILKAEREKAMKIAYT
jgi:hypothetical protein